METAYLLLGSNLGDRLQNLLIALAEIDSIGKIQAMSSIYQTAPWGNSEQADFLNQAVNLSTENSAQKLLTSLKEIEGRIGREKSEKWGSRIIDVDILFFGNAIIDSDDLKIPHPHLNARRFALAPLNEIAPDFIHPVSKKNIRTLLEECPDTLEVNLFK